MIKKLLTLLFACCVAIQHYGRCMEYTPEQARLELARHPHALRSAIGNHDFTKLKLLLAAGADVNICGPSGATPLHFAALIGCKESTELLLNHNVLMNAQNKHKKTPLHWAVLHNHEEIVELLLKRGAAVDIQDKSGWTPLHMAVWSNRQKMIALLVKHNASIIARAHDNSTPLHLADNFYALKTLLFSHYPKKVVSLERLCLRYVGSQELSWKHLHELPEHIQRNIMSEQVQQQAKLIAIQQALILKNKKGATVRDVAVGRVDGKNMVKFIDAIIKARWLADLKTLGYRG